MCIEYHIYVDMYHVSAQGVDERMINVHYYYLSSFRDRTKQDVSFWPKRCFDCSRVLTENNEKGDSEF